MAGRKKGRWFAKVKSGNNWFILILVMGVLIISSLAFLQPRSTDAAETTPSPVASPSMEENGTAVIMETADVEVEEAPPTPMEIGYTDGIIFFSSVLVLIVLVGTLRETIRRKGC
jgi:hypothetical protein